MKILLPTVGTRGDIQPYITLAQGLNESGYKAIIASHPCWESLVKQYGIDFKPIGPDIDIEYEAAYIRGKSKNWMLGMIRTMKFMFNIIEGSSHEIMELCKDVSLVIAPHSHLGATEAESCKLPYVSVTLQPSFIPKTYMKKGILKTIAEKTAGVFMNPLMVGPYNRIRKKLGIKKAGTFYDLISPYLNIIPVSPLVYPPDKFWEEKNKVAGYWGSDKNSDYLPDEELADFLKAGSPPVVISLGAMSFESKEEVSKLEIFVKALSNTEMRGIVQGFNKTLENYSLPGNMISVGSIPHSWLFQHAYCVIHHGGFGTAATALMAGVPSIVIPHVLDQYEWANRIYALGAGSAPIKCKDLNERILTDTINSLKMKYTEINSNVKQLSQKIRLESGLANSIELIADVLNRHTNNG